LVLRPGVFGCAAGDSFVLQVTYDATHFTVGAAVNAFTPPCVAPGVGGPPGILFVTYSLPIGCTASPPGTTFIPFTLARPGATTGQTFTITVSVFDATSGDVDDTHLTQVAWAIGSPGIAVGDPFIQGFHNQYFWFTGHPGGIYNLFSEPSISVNVQFAAANPADITNLGTVMRTVGVRWGPKGRAISLGVDSVDRTTRSITVTVDGSAVVLKSPTTMPVDDCVSMTWADPKLILTTGVDHNMVFTIASLSERHINTSFIDAAIDMPLQSPDLVGGLIGFTALRKGLGSKEIAGKLVLNANKVLIDAPAEKDAISSALFATDAKLNTFRGLARDCSPAPTADHHTASAGH